MRIGTLACLLFGHKFVYRRKPVKEFRQDDNYECIYVTTNYCVRCGVKELVEPTNIK